MLRFGRAADLDDWLGWVDLAALSGHGAKGLPPPAVHRAVVLWRALPDALDLHVADGIAEAGWDGGGVPVYGGVHLFAVAQDVGVERHL